MPLVKIQALTTKIPIGHRSLVPIGNVSEAYLMQGLKQFVAVLGWPHIVSG